MTRDQIDTLEGYLSSRHLDQVLDVRYLEKEGVEDSRLRSLVESYAKATRELKDYLRSQGVREGVRHIY